MILQTLHEPSRHSSSALWGAVQPDPVQRKELESTAPSLAAVMKSQAAMEGREPFEISATVFDTRSGLSLSAKSA